MQAPMPVTEFHVSPLASIGRSILNLRRDQVHSLDGDHHELEAFQGHAADLFHDLAGGEDLLSLPWLRKLLDAFLTCEDEFRAILSNQCACAGSPPVDRLVGEFFERGVKALDVCNAVGDGIGEVRRWIKYLEIVTLAVGPNVKAIGEGHLRRAGKALSDLAIAMMDQKNESVSALAHRNRSFGRNNIGSSGRGHHRARLHFRSLSWNVSRSSSSAGRQLHAIGYHLSAPHAHEIVASKGIAVLVFTMSSLLFFVMWALVAAIPCQDPGLHVHFHIPHIPQGFQWAPPVISLHERILDESKKRERKKRSNWLLKEVLLIEIYSRKLSELMDGIIEFPLVGEKEMKIRMMVKDLADVCDAMKEELELLERRVRQVFHQIVRSRMERLDCLLQHPQ